MISDELEHAIKKFKDMVFDNASFTEQQIQAALEKVSCLCPDARFSDIFFSQKILGTLY